MTPSDKNTTQVMAILEKLNAGRYLGIGGADAALAAIQQLIDEAIGLDKEIDRRTTEEVQYLVRFENRIRTEIRNNLIKVGLLTNKANIKEKK